MLYRTISYRDKVTLSENNKMSFDTEVLIIGAGMSGLCFAVQIIRKFGIRNFELIEKSEDVGGTWLANTYPGCGCDVSNLNGVINLLLHERRGMD
jgi:heterodisulfide reductase subunit A-like polyferredoxin